MSTRADSTGASGEHPSCAHETKQETRKASRRQHLVFFTFRAHSPQHKLLQQIQEGNYTILQRAPAPSHGFPTCWMDIPQRRGGIHQLLLLLARGRPNYPIRSARFQGAAPSCRRSPPIAPFSTAHKKCIPRALTRGRLPVLTAIDLFQGGRSVFCLQVYSRAGVGKQAACDARRRLCSTDNNCCCRPSCSSS